MTTPYYSILASTYGSGAYNSSNYNGNGTNAGSLTNTGIAVGLIVGAAAVLLLVAMAVRIWKRPRKNQSSEEE